MRAIPRQDDPLSNQELNPISSIAGKQENPMTELQTPRNDARIGLITLIGFLIGCASFVGIALERTTGDPLYLSISVGSVVAFILFIWRIAEHDRRAFATRRIIHDEPATDPQPEPGTLHRLATTDNGGRTIQYGQLELTPTQWAKLGEAIYNNGRLTRDIIPTGLFTSLTKNYNNIRDELQRLGIIDNNQQLTRSGLSLFATYSPTLSAVRPSSLSHQTTTTTTANGATK